MLKNYVTPTANGVIDNLIRDVQSGFTTAVFGVPFSEKCRIVSNIKGRTIFIVKSSTDAKNYLDAIKALTDKSAVYLPAKDEVLIYKQAYDKTALYDRLTALYEIYNGAEIVVTTFEALLQLFPRKVDFFTIEKGKEYDLYAVINELVKLKYKRVDYCESKASFSVRGDILEVYPVNSNDIYRIDFFGDEVESIRVFGDSVELTSVTLIGASDFVIKGSEVKEILDVLKKCYQKYSSNESIKKAGALYNRLLDGINTDLLSDGLEYLAPLLSSTTHDIKCLFGNDFTVVYDESKMLSDGLEGLYKEFVQRATDIISAGDGFIFSANQYAKKDYLLSQLLGGKTLAVQTLTASIPFFNPFKTYSLKSVTSPRYSLSFNDLFFDLKSWLLNEYRVVLCCGDLTRANSVCTSINSNGIKAKVTSDSYDYTGVSCTTFSLSNGFINHDEKLVVVGESDLFVRQKSREKTLKKKRNDLYSVPQVGDFVVHEVFGIGLIKGVKRISTLECTKDYVEIQYAGGDNLFVSTDQMDKLSKYLGGNETPTLSKIGGGEFERVKARVRQSIAKMTINLKKLYKERNEKRGFAFSPENALTIEFDEAFEFEETDDQISSWNEIKSDMESEKVMDRLLCGDVGFGKTEVAFRACFKAIADGKQTAFIAPTTILTEQHYQTALKRFGGFGVRIAVLNRFKTQKQQQTYIKQIEKGEIDLVIGTHRLFSSDVKFKDLGLLIIDEEQRFGVEHKEKLKLIASNVDTLTLSATPIPRTLHMSLSGIRDISTINTPPKQRIPVQTMVTELTDALITNAITKEIARDGQAFILYNRVESIFSFADRVKNLIPNVAVTVAHGQMPERTLENAINDFYQKKSQVLISTTIIENGIDMPSANTLIVVDSDKLGLSTLYQLKGRVGRGNVMAYAYFTYDEGKVLTGDSFKRLTALMEYSDMGSGYKIAMRDLEIRGAGNVLGKEQHGHLDRVGYELYSKLLKEQLYETTLNSEIELDIKADAFIPEKYIVSEHGRLSAYKLIAEIADANDKERVIKTLYETYGPLPESVYSLIKIAWLKVMAGAAGAMKITLKARQGKVYIKSIDCLSDGKISSKVLKHRNEVTLGFEELPVLTFTIPYASPDEYLDFMTEFFTF